MATTGETGGGGGGCAVSSSSLLRGCLVPAAMRSAALKVGEIGGEEKRYKFDKRDGRGV